MRLLLKSGGYIQIAEYHLHVQSDNGSLTDESAVYRWWKEYSNATTEMNRDARVGAKLKQLLEGNRIRHVQAEYIRVPIGGWDPGAYAIIIHFHCRDIIWTPTCASPASMS